MGTTIPLRAKDGNCTQAFGTARDDEAEHKSAQNTTFTLATKASDAVENSNISTQGFTLPKFTPVTFEWHKIEL
jgi:hypothetical protein